VSFELAAIMIPHLWESRSGRRRRAAREKLGGREHQPVWGVSGFSGGCPPRGLLTRADLYPFVRKLVPGEDSATCDQSRLMGLLKHIHLQKCLSQSHLTILVLNLPS